MFLTSTRKGSFLVDVTFPEDRMDPREPCQRLGSHPDFPAGRRMRRCAYVLDEPPTTSRPREAN